MFRAQKGPSCSARHLVSAGVLLTLLASVPRMASGDDRDLVRARSADPYVFVIFDVSGSMNWGPGGDPFAPASGDDPNSKFYQAKSALYRVLSDPELRNVHWGFATYNQDNVRAYRKHWLYKADGLVTLPWVTDGRLPYPRPGDLKYFGDRCQDDDDGDTTCDLDDNDILATCGSPRILGTTEGRGEILSYPVLGDTGGATTTEWISSGGRRFSLVWSKTAGSLGDDTITVQLTFQERNAACNADVGTAVTRIVTFTKAFTQDLKGNLLSGPSDFLNWQIDSEVDANGNPNGFWDPDDAIADNTCSGWEPNETTTTNDDDAGVLLKYRTKDDPANRHATAYDRGDVIPFDWKDATTWAGQSAPFNLTNRDLILKRLAPNYDPASPAATPDFRIAHYFQDHPDTLLATGGAGRLSLLGAYTNTPPLLPNGSTPIGNSMRHFMNWLDLWRPIASRTSGDRDTEFGCRSVNLIVLTDGDETCYVDANADNDRNPATGTTDDDNNANPCWIAKELTKVNRNVKTYVVGFGVPGTSANFLNCIATNGCTGAAPKCNLTHPDLTMRTQPDGPGPILPGNEDDLVDALKKIFEFIKAGSRSFASAAVPSVQANTQDKVVLSNFIPVADQSIWPGHLDAYIKPIPTKEINVSLPDGTVEKRIIPNRDKVCLFEGDVECRTWDGGEQLLVQAATSSDLASGTYNLGTGSAQRRVYYSQPSAIAGITTPTRLYLKPPEASDTVSWSHLLSSMGVCSRGDLACAANGAKQATGTSVVRFFHKKKQYEDPQNPDVFLDYLLGDIFHSDPIVIGEPANFRYFTSDLYKESGCGYRCFFEKHRYRRKVLLVGSNDGALHAFDAGTPFEVTESGIDRVKYNSGTGRELFSFVPRGVFPRLKSAAETTLHNYKVDSSPIVADVFTGEWQTIVVGGLREGGRGYYALDITHPDVLEDDELPEPFGGSPKYVPSCSDGVGGDCGTRPYPSVLWEFADTCALGLPCDDDLNGQPDMGDTWSVPNIGRVRVCAGTVCDPTVANNDLVDRFVAVFGGGLDPSLNNLMGNWLYMVDAGTGEILYKRALDGSAASEPAAVDTDLDGYLDTIYIGTVRGFVYKVDMKTPPRLVNLAGVGERIDPAAWSPFKIFDTQGRPIYYPPAVVFVASKGRYALSFGTGDRENLWRTPAPTGRFYTILDEGFRNGTVGLPLTADKYKSLTALAGDTIGADYINSPEPTKRPGWYLELDPGERIITKSFALSGVTIFSSFQPRTTTDPLGLGAVCGSAGTSRIFVVGTVNANSFFQDKKRFRKVEDFVTSPYTELGQTKNELGGTDDPDGLTKEQREHLNAVMRELQKLFPRNCRFANYTINLKAVRADTGLEFIAPVPVCVVEKNWKEF